MFMHSDTYSLRRGDGKVSKIQSFDIKSKSGNITFDLNTLQKTSTLQKMPY